MRFALMSIACLCAFVETCAAPDHRPPFDKSDWKKTVSVQVNPWFGLDKAPVHAKGGPNVQWVRPRHGDPWGEGMLLTKKYGIDVWTLEINEPGGWTGVWRELLDAAERTKSGTRIGMFFGMRSKTPEESIRSMTKALGGFREDLKSNPHVARAGGHPVMVIYNPHHYKPEEWGRIFAALDAEFGRMVYLFNYRRFNPQDGAAAFEERIRSYLPYFDGLSNYGSHGIDAQRIAASVIPKVMKDYPGKIYEGGIHSTYTCHFQMGGLEVPLSRDWRASVDLFLSRDPDGPDSVMLTNLFDHYENSLVYPCYEREDLLLRYLEWALSGWRGGVFRKEKTPELVLVNPCMRQLGWHDLDLEVLGFPIDSDVQSVTVTVEICNAGGKVLKRLPSRSFKLDAFRAESFSVPTLEFADERGVLPRLTWEWKGRKRVLPCNPMTILSPSMRSYRMYWARSTRSVLKVEKGREWSMDGVGPGATHPAAVNPALVVSELDTASSKDRCGGHLRHGLRRDGLEYSFTTDWGRKLEQQQLYTLPPAGKALHWYELEIENANGCRYRTLPIWETDGSRTARVSVPVWKPDGSIADVEVEDVRVPFWHYPCDRDSGSYLVDVSGHQHNGYVNGSGFGGGHLGYTGYYHYHNGPVKLMKPDQKSIFRKDEKGRGCIRFTGSDYVVVMGGTAFPGACTYEMAIRPASIGREMGLLGTNGGQINLTILPDGKLLAEHGEARLVSKTILKTNEWCRLAVVYDLKRLELFVDGKHDASVAAPPCREHEWLNHVLIGAKCEKVYDPVRKYEGDMRDVRFYGRNLTPEEFLK